MQFGEGHSKVRSGQQGQVGRVLAVQDIDLCDDIKHGRQGLSVLINSKGNKVLGKGKTHHR